MRSKVTRGCLWDDLRRGIPDKAASTLLPPSSVEDIVQLADTFTQERLNTSHDLLGRLG